MNGEQIVTEARHLIGVPFRHAGRNEHGVDCVGLVLLTAYRLGISDYEPRPYSRKVDPVQMRAEIEQCCQEIPTDEMEPGDILLLRAGGVPQHLGIYTGTTLIHSFEIAGRVVEVRWSERWSTLVEAVFRWKGLNANG